MKSAWQHALPGRSVDAGLRSWLIESGSLTARLQGAAQNFRVQLLRTGLAAPLLDQRPLLPARLVLLREVLLEVNGVPVIFAHTVLSTAPAGRLSRWLGGLGTRSLGSLLFTHPGFRRSPIEWRRLDQRHPLYQRAAACAEVGPVLWARRSMHRFGQQSVLVTEVFLPGILALQSKKRRS